MPDSDQPEQDVGASNVIAVRGDLSIPESELTWSASRSGGPGGQHANRTASRVSLRWSVVDSQALTDSQRALLLTNLGSRLTRNGELLLHVEDSRSQFVNKDLARQRLIEVVSRALERPRPRKVTRPSRASKQRRIRAKKQRGEIKRGRGRFSADD